LGSGAELQAAVAEALAFLDQALDNGFRPGMGNVIPDRFFWALAEDEEDEESTGDNEESNPSTTEPRRVH
jgi:hydroxymethylpyrimidine/phosphomethylpyrimidine kinase